ncbi:uncharacterized protein AMSG_11983 [Thecamonas trahens ATCC 50062]|uniref:Uncharacterized protein n=1 Tax=Thecamonas trahens ATCC 50062 TaxID=461836 RepID=A0A0L0DII7_THETB|nr:hypothetical protein AMSG_11983 [Thecamonas trahens ATCC 50062]KNC51138.1 hypothetical protein AMSG_11983 [Thecamonas trahens ATCC 50062]|eukprot:XP_013756434.1 hypothetical protein AMSG_11983 [Thecamonas trahens ATCC 50062]
MAPRSRARTRSNMPSGSRARKLASPMDSSASSTAGRSWTLNEHVLFVIGLEVFGRGDWRSIATKYVRTRNPSQVASHGQKYYSRQKRITSGKIVSSTAKSDESLHWACTDVNIVDILASRDAEGPPKSLLWSSLVKYVHSPAYLNAVTEDDDPNKPKMWSRTEHALFLLAVEDFGAGAWDQIADYLPRRTIQQIKTHSRKFYRQSRARAKKRAAQAQAAAEGKVPKRKSRGTALRRSVFDIDLDSLKIQENTDDLDIIRAKYLALRDTPDDVPEPIAFTRALDASRYSALLMRLSKSNIAKLTYSEVPSSMPLPPGMEHPHVPVIPAPFISAETQQTMQAAFAAAAAAAAAAPGMPPPVAPPPVSHPSARPSLPLSTPPPAVPDRVPAGVAANRVSMAVVPERRLSVSSLKRKRAPESSDKASQLRMEEDLLLSLAKRSKPLPPTELQRHRSSPASAMGPPAQPASRPRSQVGSGTQTPVTAALGLPPFSRDVSLGHVPSTGDIPTELRVLTDESARLSNPNISISAVSDVLRQTYPEYAMGMATSSSHSLGHVPIAATSRSMAVSPMNQSIAMDANALPRTLPDAWVLSSNSTEFRSVAGGASESQAASQTESPAAMTTSA